MVGIPSGRSPSPFGFGISTRRTGSGRYLFEISSSRKPANHSSTPLASIAANVIPSTPGAPALARAGCIGVVQNVLAIDLVVEEVEAKCRLRLRLTIQLSLKGPDR